MTAPISLIPRKTGTHRAPLLRFGKVLVFAEQRPKSSISIVGLPNCLAS